VRPGAEGSRECLAAFGVNVAYHHPSTLGHKPLDQSSTDTRCPAGDDGNLVRQFVDHMTS
jgi:hypothetical protein